MLSKINLSVLSVGLLCLSSAGYARSYSGSVLNMDSTARSGISVRLTGSSLTTTTDASGAWEIFDQAAGVGGVGGSTRTVQGRMTVTSGHPALSFQGHDASGRNLLAGKSVPVAHASGKAASRLALVPDTLIYSNNGKVFLRDTVSAAELSGMVRLYDTTWNPSVVYGYFLDSRDGRTYRTVQIGQQVWMAQNLSHKIDSSWAYGNSVDSLAKYGRLYRWTGATGLPDSCASKVCAQRLEESLFKGVCPTGWRVPADAEWTRLTDTALASSAAGSQLKSMSGWNGNGNGTDVFGFRALPAGDIYAGNFALAGVGGYWWTVSELNGSSVWIRFMSSTGSRTERASSGKTAGASLRCVQSSDK